MTSESSSELEAVIRAHKDLMYSFHKSVTEINNLMKFNMNAITEELKEIKKTLVIDPKYFIELQERRHESEINRLMSLLGGRSNLATVDEDFSKEFLKAAGNESKSTSDTSKIASNDNKTAAQSEKPTQKTAEVQKEADTKLTDKTQPAASDSKPNEATNYTTSAEKMPFSFGISSGQSFASLASKASSGSSFLSGSGNKGFLFGGTDLKNAQIFQAKSSPAKASNNNETKGAESGDEEEFVPDAHFEPVIPMPDLVEKKTGEEDEEVLFSSRCKLYRFDRTTKEQKERGVGEIKILKHKETGRVRCVMRRDQILNLCANFPITAGMTISQKPQSPTIYTWHCMDFSQELAGESEVFTARFKEASVAEDFSKEFLKAAGNVSKSTSDTSKTASNDNKTAAQSEKPTQKTAEVQKEADTKLADKTQPAASDSKPNEATNSPVSAEKMPFSFGVSSGQSFASLANKASSGSSFLSSSGNKGFSFGGTDLKNAQIFQAKSSPAKASNNNETKGAESGDEEEFVPDAHFEPVIPMPDLVEKKTGEEDEEVLFSSRCKLYRFDRTTKEQKERGVGEIKILKHKETGRVRCVMRRDQILNLCANFPITAGMTISQKPQSPTIYTWHCMDFSQELAGESEVFTARFKEASVAEDFSKEFLKAAV